MFHIDILDIDTHHDIDHVVHRSGGSPYWVIMCFSTDCMVMTKNGLERAKPGDCFLKAPEFVEYHFTPKDSTSGFVNDWAHCSSDILRQEMERFHVPANQLISTQNPLILRTYLCKIIQERNTFAPFWEEKIDNIMQAMLICLGRTYLEAQTADPKQYRAEFLQLRNLVREHLGESWSVSRMAQMLGLSNSRFSVLYKKYFGRSPNDDLVDMRLEYSKVLLASTGRCLADIAQLCGFQNEFYFSRVFKSHEKISPGAYRRQP